MTRIRRAVPSRPGLRKPVPEPEAPPPNGRYRQAFESSPDALFVLDLQGRLFEVNAQACAGLGYTREELLSLTLAEIEGNHDFQEEAGRWTALRPGESATRPAAHRRRDGTSFPVETRVVCLDPGPPRLFLAASRNVAAQRRLEEELRQAQKMEALGRMAGGVSHDFNNLLTAIVGYSDLALGRLTEDSPFRAELEEIKRAGERAAGLTRQLLAFSRRQAVRPREIELNAAARGLDSMLRRLIPESVRIELDLDPDVGHVRLDPAQLDQVILNLALNARDAMPQGGKLRIATSPVELDAAFCRRHSGSRPGAFLMLSVSDTGSGLSTEAVAHLFEPFFTTKDRGRGTGLGLATVYGIVRQGGGFLSYATDPNRGTTFNVYLPRHDAESPSPHETQIVQTLAGKESVLLVEDDPAIRRFSAAALRAHGYRVLEAADPQEALRLAEDPFAVQVLLTDMVMPGMSGRDLARRLRERSPDLPVVYMSGYTDDTALQEGQLGSGSGFVPKPFTVVELLTRLRKTILRNNSSPRIAPLAPSAEETG